MSKTGMTAAGLHVKPKPLLWQDTCRHMGFIQGFTKYQLYEDRLVISELFRQYEVPLRHTGNMKITRSLWQWMCGVADIRIPMNGHTYILHSIKNPSKVEQLIHTRASECKKFTGTWRQELKPV